MEWTPNANQKKFLEVLSNEPHTLAELGEDVNGYSSIR